MIELSAHHRIVAGFYPCTFLFQPKLPTLFSFLHENVSSASVRHFYWVPTIMFSWRNKKNIFLIPSLTWSSERLYCTHSACIYIYWPYFFADGELWHRSQSISGKKYICNLCDYSANLPSDLRRHVAIHTGEKPFTCEICGNHFRRKYHLDCHVIIHTGEKPFTCEICGNHFTRKYNLDRHRLRHKKDNWNKWS